MHLLDPELVGAFAEIGVVEFVPEGSSNMQRAWELRERDGARDDRALIRLRTQLRRGKWRRQSGSMRGQKTEPSGGLNAPRGSRLACSY
jgi:hypothetical protein